MQWTAGDNGGFSKARKRRLTRPLPDGLYGPERVNAADQRHDHQSLLVVHAQPHLHLPAAAGDRLVDGRGLGAAQPARCLAHVCREKSGWAMVALHNFGADSSIVPIQLQGVPSGCILVDLLGGLTEHKLDSEGRIDVDLDGLWLPVAAPEATGGRADHLNR